jgi:hypothetical protein
MNQNLIFKPKKEFILVPGAGVIQRDNFTEDHTKALLKRADKAGVSREEFIKQHLVVAGYGDMPLFEGDSEQEAPVKKGRKKKEAE